MRESFDWKGTFLKLENTILKNLSLLYNEIVYA